MTRGELEAAFRAAIAACDPAVAVAAAVRELSGVLGARPRVGIAIGKAALAMARGAGAVKHGVAIAPGPIDRATVGLPRGWRAGEGGHPMPDRRSNPHALATMWIARSSKATDVVLALISGGASALCEVPRPGVTLDQIRARTAELMASGAPIAELNRARTELSAIKGGKLAALANAPVITLIASDVIGDDPRVIGSGPTIRDRADDITRVILPMRGFAEAVAAQLDGVRVLEPPIAGDVDAVAARLAATPGAFVAWGEPTVTLAPLSARGEGGRAQQLALTLARHFAGSSRVALVVGSDGIDGPPPRARPSPAGAFVDGDTWARVRDPEAALARNAAGTALAEIGALVVTGATGINHADIAIVTTAG